MIAITAIVPAYNVESYLGPAIDSLLNQTKPFHEIIIVDDGSTDSTGALVDGYRGIPGVKVFHTRNQGQGIARNIGLSHATGDYVYFFDADDLVNLDFVESMDALVTQDPEIDMIYFSGATFVEEGFSSAFMPSYDRKLDREYASGIEATGSLLRSNVFFAQPCLYLSKRSLWKDHEIAFLAIEGEDEEVVVRLGCSAGVTICLSRVFFQRRIRPGSTMTRPRSTRDVVGRLAVLESIASYCNKNRAHVSPILRELTQLFYHDIDAYLWICRAVKTRPEYNRLIKPLWEMRRFPAPRQLYEIVVPLSFQTRLSNIRHSWFKNVVK